MILQTGGGVGYAFSRIRPKGDDVFSPRSNAGGPVSFMHVFDRMCQTIKQGGLRCGAQMAILNLHHPDIGRFVVARRKQGVLSTFSISVAITDDFIQAVKKGSLLYPVQSANPKAVPRQ